MDKFSGIQGFSQPTVEYALWAADKQHKPNDVRALLSSRKISFQPCIGSYKGELELSYFTAWRDYVSISAELCREQESILHLGARDSHNRPKASLLFVKAGQLEDLGRLHSVSIEEAMKRNAWTIRLQPVDGEICAFVCDHADAFGRVE